VKNKLKAIYVLETITSIFYTLICIG